MKTVLITRHKTGKRQTLGRLYVRDSDGTIIFQACSLERGWLNNARGKSCVPAGCFPLVLEYSPRFKKDLWELKEVPNRSETKLHAANYWHQLNGCISLGSDFSDIDKDGLTDVIHSRDTMAAFHKAMGDDCRAIINIIELYLHEATV